MHLREPQTQTLQAIPDGVAGIEATLAHMMDYVREYKKDPQVRGLARELTLSLPQKHFSGEVEALFEFVRDEIRYLWDIADVETLQTPVVTLENQSGDCDDKATLLAALLESIGHKTRFVAAGFQPGQYEHVFLETKIGNNWIALDPTEPVPMGWTPPGMRARMVRHN
ncbi:MAG TPA: transglutaminase-like domain-containing protein [Burkholderiaceae bacterium]|nr:transglutaminase-like domain-containing protein [Burkholderiaceae bacterium]